MAHLLESPYSAALTVKVRLDAFDCDKEAIDDMVTALVKEEVDEIKHRGFCTDLGFPPHVSSLRVEFSMSQIETENTKRKKTDIHDPFTRTFNPALLRKSTGVSSVCGSEAYALLSEAYALPPKVAHSLVSPCLAVLAAKVRLDAPVRGKEATDDMVAALTKEKADEVKHLDYCTDEFNRNQMGTQKTERKKSERHDLFTRIFYPAFLQRIQA